MTEPPEPPVAAERAKPGASPTSRERVEALLRARILGAPLVVSRLAHVVRYLPRYVTSPALRREWSSVDAVERAFSAGRTPSPPLGKRSALATERAVEVAWVLARAAGTPGAPILDVGSAFAPHTYRRVLHRWARRADLHLADLVPVAIAGTTSHVADVRALPFAHDTFDRVVCISTLEHIGMDNRVYGLDAAGSAPAERDDVVALREMGRVARGTVLVTVPGGRSHDHGWFRQYSPDEWDEVVGQAGLVAGEVDYFGHTSSRGWFALERGEVEGFHFGVDAAAAAAVICSSLRAPA